MQSPNNGLGRYGEEVAARRLAHDGLHILERNWRCAEGELDIVALDGDTLAICEVKTRSEHAFQQPTEGIDRTKAERLRRLAERWLAERWPTHFELLAERVTPRPHADGSAVPPGPSSQPDRQEVSAPTAEPAIEGRAGASSPTSGETAAGSAPKKAARKRVARKPEAKSIAAAGGVTALATVPAPPPPGGVRIDLVAVINRLKGAAQVEHVRGAV
ncbi:YraN family protein [Kitasatospora sp. NPDC051914]|uniref:YraN family protein n=1 Tax=Kitasatospora sp. NPDC051914 TaxID=3154945 RepID=UPI0034430EC6